MPGGSAREEEEEVLGRPASPDGSAGEETEVEGGEEEEFAAPGGLAGGVETALPGGLAEEEEEGKEEELAAPEGLAGGVETELPDGVAEEEEASPEGLEEEKEVRRRNVQRGEVPEDPKLVRPLFFVGGLLFFGRREILLIHPARARELVSIRALVVLWPFRKEAKKGEQPQP